MTVERAKNYVSHFINSTSSYVRVPNSGSKTILASDNLYPSVSVYESKGCIHYAYFISYVMYGDTGSRKYLDESIGSVTANGLKSFFQKYAQAGEQLRFTTTSNYAGHSLVYISSTDNGFYTLQYYGKSDEPFLSYSTYEYFSNLINKIGVSFWIYNAEIAENQLCRHQYNSNGYCSNCNAEYPVVTTDVSAGYYAKKDGVIVRSRPYASGNIIKTLKRTETLYVIGQSYNSVGNLWFKLSDGNWVYSNDVERAVTAKCTSHTYDSSGYCTKCKAEYPINFTAKNETFYTNKDDVPIRSRPYSSNSIIVSIPKGTQVDVIGSGKNSIGNLWYKIEDGTWIYSENLTKTKPTNATTRTVTIKYDANGGSSAPSSHSMTKDSSGTAKFTLSSTKPTRSGYTFLGWRLDNSSAYGIDSPGQSITISLGSPTNNATLTYYAQWEADSANYTITYDANGGSGAPAQQTKTADVPLVLSSVKPTRTGYEFAGWSLTATSGSTLYAPGSTCTIDGNVTFYAMWTTSYTLTYDANGGTGAPPRQTKKSGESWRINSIEPTRNEYTFEGWATVPNGAAVIGPGQSYGLQADTTLYAVWKAIPEISNVNVTFTGINSGWIGIRYQGDSLGGTDPGRMVVTSYFGCEARVYSSHHIDAVEFIIYDSAMTQIAKRNSTSNTVSHSVNLYEAKSISYNVLESSKTGYLISNTALLTQLVDGQTYYWKIVVTSGGQKVESDLQSFVYKTFV